MIRRRAILSLLLAAALATGCSAGASPGKPELPLSVSPGWTRKAFDQAAPPSCVPARVKPECWRADYVNNGSAQVWVCGYAEEGSAFDALQRTESEADTVKFQEGKYLVIVKWGGVSRTEITALVRGIQKAFDRR